MNVQSFPADVVLTKFKPSAKIKPANVDAGERRQERFVIHTDVDISSGRTSSKHEEHFAMLASLNLG